MINVVEVKTKRQKRQFVDFPTKLYNGNEFYVHPLRGDELNIFNPKKNVSYDECEIVFYLAYKDGNIAGRICGILQKVYNEKTSRKCVRFSRFDCIEDFEVAQALLTKVEEWALMHGMDTIHGPLGFHDLEREGLLIEGFDRLATFEENYNYPYYAEYLEKCGYKKDIDYVSYIIHLPEKTDERIQRIRDMVMTKYHFSIATAKNKKAYIKKYKDQIFDLLDDAYGDLYGVIPYNAKLRKQIIDQFNLVIKLDYIVSIVDEDDKMVAFGFALPSLARAVQKCKGKLFPTGVFRILHARDHGEVVDFGLVGIRKEFQGKGITAIILDYIISNARRLGITTVETNLHLENNAKILATWKNFDNTEMHKRYRCFIKNLKEKPEEKKSKKVVKKSTKKTTNKSGTTKKTSSKKATTKKTTNTTQKTKN